MHDGELVLGSLAGAHYVKNSLVSHASQTWKCGMDKTREPTDDIQE